MQYKFLLYTKDFTQDSLHYILYAIHNTQCIIPFILQTLYIIQYTKYSINSFTHTHFCTILYIHQLFHIMLEVIIFFGSITIVSVYTCIYLYILVQVNIKLFSMVPDNCSMNRHCGSIQSLSIDVCESCVCVSVSLRKACFPVIGYCSS